MINLNRLQSILRHEVATIAQKVLMPRFNRVGAEAKADGSLLTEADLLMQQQLTPMLRAALKGSQVLGEEMEPDEQQALLQNEETHLWVVDPLDGTSNFANGIPFFSSSVALIHQREIVLGMVYDPVRDECFHALRDGGAFLNDSALPIPATLQRPLFIGNVDFKRLPADLIIKLAQQPPYKSHRSFGSVALDWGWLAAGRAQVYLHGKQKLWDYAAGMLILGEAGGQACTLDGEAVYNHSVEGRSVLAALSEQHFDTWRQYLGVADGETAIDKPA
jgi:myo-inositol-1(or 4)-monophosphatase